MKIKDKIVSVVIAGGTGSRLWPLSRNQLPKQFHKLYSNKTMLQETLLRIDKFINKDTMIICNKSHKFIVKDQISAINKKCNILLEPCSKTRLQQLH